MRIVCILDTTYLIPFQHRTLKLTHIDPTLLPIARFVLVGRQNTHINQNVPAIQT